jgi:hypothetical protein
MSIDPSGDLWDEEGSPGPVVEGRTMSRPVELKGVIHGETITLDEKTFLPDGYRVTLHLILDPAEGLRLAAGAWADMTPEQVAELEDILSKSRGRPIKLTDGGPE